MRVPWEQKKTKSKTREKQTPEERPFTTLTMLLWLSIIIDTIYNYNKRFFPCHPLGHAAPRRLLTTKPRMKARIYGSVRLCINPAVTPHTFPRRGGVMPGTEIYDIDTT